MKQLSNCLFVDIETIPLTEKLEYLNEAYQQLWIKKAARLNSERNAKELFFEKAGIYSEFGKIIAIAIGYLHADEGKETFLRVKVIYDHEEKNLLEYFSNLLRKKFNKPNLYLVAHNGKSFVFPYLCRRLLVNNLPLPAILDTSGKKPWHVAYKDTMEMWKFTDKKYYTSLDTLRCVFNLPANASGIDSMQISRIYYETNDLERIAEHCREDVVATVQVYLKLNSSALLPNEHIIRL